METALEIGAGDMLVEWTPFPPDGAPPVIPQPVIDAAAKAKVDLPITGSAQ